MMHRLLLSVFLATALMAACSADLPDWLSGEWGGDTHEVRPGDTLSGIAALHGISADELERMNGATYPSLREDPGLIRVGWELNLPRQGVTSGAVDVDKGSGEPSAGDRSASASKRAPAVATEEELRVAEQEMLRLTNQAREQAGLPDLVEDPQLVAVARERAQEIVLNYSHDGFTAACQRHGLLGVRWLAENIAAIPDSPALPGSGTIPERFVSQGWLLSPAHRASILNPQFGAIGLALYHTGYRWTAVQVFGD